ncbi:MAG: type II toxin-antitoxin system VapC family toxin, partial [Alphaproteobacteria bacterium]
MTPVLVDSNVILDVATDDPEWRVWSEQALLAEVRRSLLVINPIVFAEVSTRFADVALVDEVLPEDTFMREPLPYAAGFLAARAYLAYRRRGGVR